jgi:hypothetical protein
LNDVILTPTKRWLDTSAKLFKVAQAIEAALAHLTTEALAAQCLAINRELEEPVSRSLGCEALLTLGWLDDGTEEGLYKFGDDHIKKLLDLNYTLGQESHHAWLTLPSMEILDVTYHTTGAVRSKNAPVGKYKYGAIIATHADEHPEGLVYKPMIVGKGFLKGRK